LWEEKQQLVVDTSVCIDIFNGGILESVTRLAYQFLLPDVILFEELIDPPCEKFIGAGFVACGTTGGELYTFVELTGKYKAPSRNDLFALTIAKRRGLILLSGDKDLRSAAKKEKVEVHGIIWILDQLVSESIMTPVLAADMLEKIHKAGAWLPERECTERLRRWRG
jgi:rRNA-processing protein FCF1